MLNLLVLKVVLFLAPEYSSTIPSNHSIKDYAVASDSLIERTMGELNKIKTIKYHQIFDQKSENENRCDHVESEIYIEFLPTVEPYHHQDLLRHL